MTYESALKLVNSDPFIRDTLKALSSGKSPKMPNSYDLGRHSSTPTYQVWGGVLKCSHRAGVVALAYRALPIDDEGYPLLMDHISAIEAVYWYITMKYYYQKWVSGQVSDRVYTHAEQAWAHYSRQTYGIAQMPDQGDMQGIKNMWLRLVPDINADERGFDDLYKPEDLRL